MTGAALGAHRSQLAGAIGTDALGAGFWAEYRFGMA